MSPHVHDAREFVRERLAERGLGSVEDEVLLVVSELVTNAVKHAPGPVHLTLLREGGRIEVQVGDRSSARPVEREVPTSALSGRGLLIVAACSVAWGVRSTSAGGKCTWAAFDVPLAAAADG